MNCRTFTSPWGNEDTQTLIDILEKYHVKTTFFVVGDWAEKYPESVKALHDAGHEVMSHSNHHDHYNSLSAEQITADITASNERISAVTGVTPTLAVTDEVVGVVRKGLEEHPDIGAVVLECTDLPPYSARIRDELDIPMFDINTMISCVAMALNEYKMF